MNYGPLIFLSAFFALSASWFGFVLTPHLQVGHLQPTNTIPAGITYPVARPGLAKEGIDVYRANGCAYCHSQQVRQTATACEVILSNAGTNQPALVSALMKLPGLGLNESQAKQLISNLPKTILHGVTMQIADDAVKTLKIGDAKVELSIVAVGPDIDRAFGKRRSVAEDFLYDYPVMLGSQRIGPDLANAGLRRPDRNWHLLHLYAPNQQVPGSSMPPYRFLFEKRKINRAPSPDALQLPSGLAPEPGSEIVPKPEALSLVAYLTSLQADAPLYVAPLTVPVEPVDTNAPAASAASTNANPANPK